MATEPTGQVGVTNTVVVGVDGSASSLHALEWAAGMVHDGGTLHAVFAVSLGVELTVAVAQVDSAKLVRARRDQLEHEWTAAVRERGVPVACHVLEDEVATALVRVAGEHRADLIVVGASGEPRHLPRRIGNVVTQLIDRARTPFAMIPASAPDDGGSVVVGVDPTAAPGAALQWAVALASERHRALVLVRTGSHRQLFSVEGLLAMIAYFIRPEELRDWALEDLAQLADQIRSSTDEQLEITWAVPGTARRPHILEASSDAAALVIEARPDPNSPVPAWVHHVIRHAPCPLVLYPTTHSAG